MRQLPILSLFLTAACGLLTPPQRGAAGQDNPKDKPAPPTVRVSVDTREVPELADWGDKAKALVEKWHPRIAALLPSDGFTPPGAIKLVFKKDMKGVAYTAGATIVIAAKWVKAHPDDFGMVVHELTHAVQDYRRQNRGAGWLVEGIADYVRFFHYEPKTKLTLNPRRASYRDGYRTTAQFLAWVEKTHDKDVVRKLNEALRKATYKDELFRTWTTKTLDELWRAFLAAREKAPGIRAAERVSLWPAPRAATYKYDSASDPGATRPHPARPRRQSRSASTEGT